MDAMQHMGEGDISSTQGPKAVLQVLRRFETTPGFYDALALVEAQRKAGGRALIAGEGGSLAYEFERRGAEIVELPAESNVFWRRNKNIKRVSQMITDLGIDLVHVHKTAPAWSAAPAASQAGVPLVTTVHHAFDSSAALQKSYAAIMAASTRIIAPAEAIADELANAATVMGEGDSAKQKIRLIRGGVDLDVFDSGKVTAARLTSVSHSWRLPDDKPLILLPGNPDGHELLLAALNEISDLDFVCVFVTRYLDVVTTGREQLNAAIREAGLADRAFVAEPCRDIAAALNLCSVVVLPSAKPKGFRRRVAEAQALGRPVVALRTDGTAEQIEDGVTGFLVEKNVASAFAEKLKHCLTLSDEARDKIQAAACETVRANSDLRRMTTETMNLYSEVLNQTAIAR